MNRLCVAIAAGAIAVSVLGIPVAAQESPDEDTSEPDVTIPVEAAPPSDVAPVEEHAAPVPQPTATPEPAVVPELILRLPQNQRSDQPVNATLLTKLGPTLPIDESTISPLQRGLNENAFNTRFSAVASPVRVPLFAMVNEQPDCCQINEHYYVLSVGITSGPEKYAYNCRSGQCEGSASDVWVAMPPAQREQYLSALLDVYEPIAEAVNRPGPDPFAPGNVQPVPPTERALVRVMPLPAGNGARPVASTILAAARITADQAGAGLVKSYLGPHLTSDVYAVTDGDASLPRAQWTPHVIN